MSAPPKMSIEEANRVLAEGKAKREREAEAERQAREGERARSDARAARMQPAHDLYRGLDYYAPVEVTRAFREAMVNGRINEQMLTQIERDYPVLAPLVARYRERPL